MADAWIAIGRVRSVNPRSREVRVGVLGGYARAFEGMAWIRFARGADAPLRCKVAAIRGDAEVMVVVLGPGLPRERVDGLRGATVVAAPEEIPARPGQGWRLTDLLGMTVVLPGGALLGAIGEVYEGPANDAFAVDRPDGGRCLLPAIPEVIESVDFDRRTVEVGDVAPYILEA